MLVIQCCIVLCYRMLCCVIRVGAPRDLAPVICGTYSVFRESPQLDRKIPGNKNRSPLSLQCAALSEAPSVRDVPAKPGQLEPTRPEEWDPCIAALTSLIWHCTILY